MRTTIRLDDQLLREAKEVAARTGRTLTAVIEEALRESFARRKQAKRRNRLRLPTFKGHGVHPGLDLNNSAALLDFMDEADGKFSVFRGQKDDAV